MRNNIFGTPKTAVFNLMKKAARNKKHVAHDDARKIIFRKERFKAILISSSITDDILQKIKDKNKVSTDKIFWEIQKPTYSKQALEFPVAKEHLNLQKATDLSELLFRIPAKQNTWLYISPELESLILSEIDELKPSS